MLAAVHGRMAETVAAGMGELDWSAMAAYTVDDRPTDVIGQAK
jgi:hypothetical protein